MEEDSELKFIKTSLRAVLQSIKGGVEAHRLIGMTLVCRIKDKIRSTSLTLLV